VAAEQTSDANAGGHRTFDGEWLFEVIQRVQPLLCDRSHGDAETIAALLATLPAPPSRLDQLALHGLLLELLVARGHAGTSTGARGCREYVEQVLRSRKAPARSGEAAFAARAIERDSSLTLEAVFHELAESAPSAGDACTHLTSLRRHFKHAYGISMKQYQTQMRVREAVRLFLAGNRKICSVARLVGYSSETNFYKAVRQVTKRTPHELQQAPESTLRHLIERLTIPPRDADRT